MFNRARKLRYRRTFRMRRQQVATIGEQTDQHFFRRFDSLIRVRRFVAVWVSLALLLIGCSVAQNFALSNYYQTLQPAPGGMYTEGVVGIFTNANPVYASTVADRTVSKLIFSGLLKHDEKNQLVSDLAESWKVDAKGQVYTVTLRQDLKWHDSKPLTSEDVVFTYQVIQNPDTQSPLNSSWQDVKVSAIDKRTVTFTLSNPLAAFPQSLTNGIIPKHILGDTAVSNMRTSSFNTANPIGSGPFIWQGVEVLGDSPADRREVVSLSSNADYHLGKPNLDNFAVNTFRDEDQMIDSYKRHEIQAMSGVSSEPREISRETEIYEFTQTAATMVFFKTTKPPFTDKAVRQALIKSINTKHVRDQLGYSAETVDGPLLKKQIGYDPEVKQFDYDKPGAEALFSAAGWVSGKDKVRQKESAKLEFTITTENTPENARIARNLQQQWSEVGAKVGVSLLNPQELQVSLASHEYDVLIRGISIGADPDVFAYWHSSQSNILAKGRLNFSEYKSDVVDEALGLGRTRADAGLRAAKYKPFLAAWREDAPAFGLYQPRFLYVSRQSVHGLDERSINNASDRLNNVHDWMVRRVKTTIE